MEKRFQNFTVLVTKINRSIHKIKAEEMSVFGLKSPHVSCLYYLYRFGALTAKELCDVCAEDKAAISRSIDFLESNGYILCNDNAKKRYRSALELTEKGREVGLHIAQKIESIVDQASQGICEQDRAVLYQSLSIICDNLENICKKYED